MSRAYESVAASRFALEARDAAVLAHPLARMIMALPHRAVKRVRVRSDVFNEFALLWFRSSFYAWPPQLKGVEIVRREE